LSGTIALGQKIALVAKVAPERTFKIRVSAFEAPRRMVWEDGNRIFRGVRTFLLKAEGDATVVTMAEAYTGAFLPQIAPHLPDFTEPFETFVADLKRRAEA
ncbi:MAG: SRPBCC domain-containing protein, partial [Myxococcota bacterium]